MVVKTYKQTKTFLFDNLKPEWEKRDSIVNRWLADRQKIIKGAIITWNWDERFTTCELDLDTTARLIVE